MLPARTRLALQFVPPSSARILGAVRYASSDPPKTPVPPSKKLPPTAGKVKKVRKVPSTRDLPTNEAINVIKTELAQKRAAKGKAAPGLAADAEGFGMGDRLIAKVRSEGPMPFPEFMAAVNGSRPAGFRRHLTDVSRFRKNDWMDFPLLRKAYGLAVGGYFHRAWLEHDQVIAKQLSDAGVDTPATIKECLQGPQLQWAQRMLDYQPVDAPGHTRLVITNPEEGALTSEIIVAMAMSPNFANTLQQIVLVERRGLRQQAQSRLIRVAIEQALKKSVVTITPNSAVPPLKPNVVQLRWVKSLRDVPQTPGLWTMLLSHDFLGSLPAHMLERSHEGFRNVQLTYGMGATGFSDAATEEANRERLLLKPYGPYLDLAWPTGMYDPRMFGVSLGARALAQTGVFDAGRRMAHIVSGRANISPQADAPGRPSHAVGANDYGLFAHRPRHSYLQEVTQGSQIDLRDGARDSVGGVGLVLDPMTTDIRSIAKGLCAVKPGKPGSTDILKAVGSGDLVAPVDLAAFTAGVNAVARIASHPLNLKSFWKFQGIPELVDHWVKTRTVNGVPLPKDEADTLMSTWRTLNVMAFKKVQYQAVGIEAPPFRVEQYLSALNGYSPVPTEVEPLDGEGTRADLAAKANEFPIGIPPFDREDPLKSTIKGRNNAKSYALAFGLAACGVCSYIGYGFWAWTQNMKRARQEQGQRA